MDERNQGKAFIQQTYGEMYNLDAGTTTHHGTADNIGPRREIQSFMNDDSILTLSAVREESNRAYLFLPR